MDAQETAETSRRLGPTFHRTFPLSLVYLQQVLELAMRNPGSESGRRSLERRLIRELTQLGSIQVEAAPRYAYGTGLLDAQYAPTAFGRFAARFNPLLNGRNSQWLMHYHLSAPGGPGPAFWHFLVNRFMVTGNEFGSSDVAEAISAFHMESEGKDLAEKSARATATVFIHSYTKADGLGSLNILQEIDRNKFHVNDDPELPPTWVIAYAIVDYWKSTVRNQVGINLDQLTEESGIGNLFMIGAGKVASVLQKMQLEGFVELYRVAPPYQVLMLRPDFDAILEKVYASE